MPPAIPKTPERNEVKTIVAPMRAKTEGAIAGRLCRSRERAVDHVDRVLEPVERHKRAEARAFFLAEQHLVEHIEPIERDARFAILGLDLSSLVEEWLASADLVDYLLNLFCTGIGGELRQRIAQVEERRAFVLARLAESLLRQHEVAKIVNGVTHKRIELRMRLRRHARAIAADEAPQRLGVFRVRGSDQGEQ